MPPLSESTLAKASVGALNELSESVLCQGIQNYIHTKSGTVHSLTGSTGSDYISFTATANYYENDTWKLNGNPITVNFANGLPLVVGGIITGDFVWGRLDGNVLTLSHNQIESNKNILDNWYFKNPVNQRGLTEYSGTSDYYSVDRWLSNPEFSATLQSDGLKLTQSKLKQYTSCIQTLENPQQYANNIITFSFLYKVDPSVTGSVIHGVKVDTMAGSGILSASYKGSAPDGNNIHLITGTGQVPSTVNNYINAIIYSQNFAIGESFTVIAAKFEFGNRQTLAHKNVNGYWVLNDPPPNFEEELAKCQRFYFYGNIESSSLCINSSATKSGYTNIYLPVPLRVKPSLGSATNARAYTTEGNVPVENVTLFIGNNKYDNGVEIKMTPLTQQSYLSGNIELNANL